MIELNLTKALFEIIGSYNSASQEALKLIAIPSNDSEVIIPGSIIIDDVTDLLKKHYGKDYITYYIENNNEHIRMFVYLPYGSKQEFLNEIGKSIHSHEVSSLILAIN